jgi:hypothetical protein
MIAIRTIGAIPTPTRIAPNCRAKQPEDHDGHGPVVLDPGQPFDPATQAPPSEPDVDTNPNRLELESIRALTFR